MATTSQTYNGDGSTTVFTFTVPYIDTADVKARVNNVATTAISVSGSSVTFATAPPAGTNNVKIFRDTNNSSIEANFQSGSALRAVDFNDNFTQLLYVTQESTDVADTATADADAAVTASNNAVATANTANTNSTNAVNTANTASSTASTADTNASTALSTANSAASDASTALNNSRESDGQGGFTTAISKANTASADASAAVSTANTASTNATAAVNTANTASSNASTALTTANTANTNATTALNNSREDDGQGGFTTAISKANTALNTANTASTNATAAVNTANTASTNASSAVTTANAASATATAAQNAVAGAAFYTPIANVAGIPGSPSDEDRYEIADSTNIQSFTPLSGIPSGFTGSSDLTVRIEYDSSASSWIWKQYFAADPEARYATIASVNTNTTNIATKMPLAGGTFTGAVNFDDNVVIKGDSTNGSGKITLNCEVNTHGVHIKGPPHSAGATYTLTLPNNTGTNGQALLTNGSGVMSWGDVSVDPVIAIDAGNFDNGSSTISSTLTIDGGSF